MDESEALLSLGITTNPLLAYLAIRPHGWRRPEMLVKFTPQELGKYFIEIAPRGTT